MHLVRTEATHEHLAMTQLVLLKKGCEVTAVGAMLCEQQLIISLSTCGKHIHCRSVRCMLVYRHLCLDALLFSFGPWVPRAP